MPRALNDSPKITIAVDPAKKRGWAAAAEARGQTLSRWVALACDAAAAEQAASGARPRKRSR